MLTRMCLASARIVGQCVRQQAKRSFASTSVLAAKSDDMVKDLFIQKIKEYEQKQMSSGAGGIELTPENQKDLEDQLNRLEKQYETNDEDVENFPELACTDYSLKYPIINEKADMEHFDLAI